MGFFDKLKFSRLREGLAKTRDSLMGKVERILIGKTDLDDSVLESLEEAFITADLGVAATETIIGRLRSRVKQEKYETTAELNDILRKELHRILESGLDKKSGVSAAPADATGPGRPGATAAGGNGPGPSSRPHVIMVVGVNGTGKTTTIGKLAHQFVQEGKRVMIAAGDTFRAAANEQLEIWASRAGAEIIQGRDADPASVVFNAHQAAVARQADILLVDTAGRLHVRANLMEELKKIHRVMKKLDPGAPHEVYLVLDATTGQNALRQAAEFSSAVGVTGLVLTKLDGTAKGGIVVAIRAESGIPVKYVGVGEKVEDLQPFDGEAFSEALLGEAVK